MKILTIIENNSVTGVRYGTIEIADKQISNRALQAKIAQKYQYASTKKSTLIKNHMQHRKQK